jgi:hypothetical protein
VPTVCSRYRNGVNQMALRESLNGLILEDKQDGETFYFGPANDGKFVEIVPENGSRIWLNPTQARELRNWLTRYLKAEG